MLIRLSLLLILSTCLCPAAFRASTNVVVSIEVDTDEDGLDDEMELLLGTNPDDADTDADDSDVDTDASDADIEASDKPSTLVAVNFTIYVPATV